MRNSPTGIKKRAPMLRKSERIKWQSNVGYFEGLRGILLTTSMKRGTLGLPPKGGTTPAYKTTSGPERKPTLDDTLMATVEIQGRACTVSYYELCGNLFHSSRKQMPLMSVKCIPFPAVYDWVHAYVCARYSNHFVS